MKKNENDLVGIGIGKLIRPRELNATVKKLAVKYNLKNQIDRINQKYKTA